MRRTVISVILWMMLLPYPAAFGVGLPPGTSIQLLATADYIDVLGDTQSADPATVTLTVVQVAGVDVDWEPSQDATAQGQDLYVPIKITNTGNGIDAFNLSVSSNSAWATAIIYDDNDDGIHQDSEQWVITDTSLVADGYCPCFARVSVPADASAGDVINVTATSILNPTAGTDTASIDIASPGQRATKLTASASPASPYIAQTVTVQGELKPAMQQQLSVIITDPNGRATATTCNTQSDGKFLFSFVPSKAGDYTIAVSFPGASGYASSSASVTVTVNDKVTTSIQMTASPANLVIGATASIAGTIRPAMATSISLTCTNPLGVATQAQVQSDMTGAFSWTKMLDTVGQWTIDASYAGTTTNASCAATLPLQVSSGQAAHSVSMVSGPTVAPTIVVLPETTQCSATAVDSLGHGVSYQWSDGGAGGTFTPSANVQEPAYTAAANNTSQDIQVTLTCTATCGDNAQVQTSGTAVLTVQSVDSIRPEVIFVTPQRKAVSVEIGARIAIRFNKAMDPQSTQDAISIVPATSGLTYSWSSDGATLSIQHAPFATDTTYACTVGAGAMDTNGLSPFGPYQWTFTTVPAARFDPNEIGARPSATFGTPHVIVSDPELSGAYTLQVSVPQELTVDTTQDSEGNLVCVRKGVDMSSITSSWDATGRVISITGQATTPASSVEVVKSIRLTAPSTTGSMQVLLNENPSLTVRVGSTPPGDFNGDSLVNITDAGWFVQEWVRWQQTPTPTFDPDVDTPYDLAPHTAGVWPNWIPIGDQTIDTQDADAFIDCWTSAHNQQQVTSAGAYEPVSPSKFVAEMDEAGNALTVTVKDAPFGAFEMSIPIPESAKFNSTLDRKGNLASVSKLGAANTLLFSEYDPQTRTIRIAGTVTARGPMKVAAIKFLR
ncbi:MAG: Ig-like domain-containing protein [Armatimonadetes bacterium]|nr:Ig-like domain-containing protein [Armatimonadota bacterium]